MSATGALTDACPGCNSHRVYVRPSAGGTWRCKECEATFDEPFRRPSEKSGPPYCHYVGQRAEEMEVTSLNPHKLPLRTSPCGSCFPAADSVEDLREWNVEQVQWIRTHNNKPRLHRVVGSEVDE